MQSIIIEEYPLEDLTELEKFYPLIEFQREERVYLMKLLQETIEKLDSSKSVKKLPQYIKSQENVRELNTKKLEIHNSINVAHEQRDIVLMDELVDKLVSLNYYINQEIENRIELVQSLGKRPS
ncbi:Skp family chaperone for outer membrane proteins [Acetoanaerobium pronyense]|uniref:Skp family chaperone for outer membrane proteins n=1 Tax=Acetoanaerobium pronyense TaxID=1482736 RepID=A0ABS4KLY2_9FIRM|nr:hypothetical protein [Acetoanaerobium pronyense]MBP2028236.1 Skp family chaperone for outer membrane proteins [Acetoanaerobium pronyense]